MTAGAHLRSVNASIRSAGSANDARNAAIIALTRAYARQIDAAADLAALVAALPTPNDGNDRQALDALRRRVSEEQTVADFGPKLLAALTQLRVAPSQPEGRGQQPARPSRASSVEPTPEQSLDRLRARHRARQEGRPMPDHPGAS